MVEDFRKTSSFKEDSYKSQGLKGYATPESLRDMSLLVKELVDYSNIISGVRQDELSSFYLRHGITMAGSIDDITNPKSLDVYTYASSAMLARAISCSKSLYHKEGLSINDTEVLSNDFIERITPNNLEMRLYEIKGSENSSSGLLNGAAEQLLQGIETQMLVATTYFDAFSAKSTPSVELEKFLDKEILKINDYAKFAGKIAKFMPDISGNLNAAMIEATSKLFSDFDTVKNAIVDDEISKLYSTVFGSHAYLFGLHMQSPWPFVGSAGEEASIALRMSVDVLDAMSVISHLKYTPLKKENNNFVSVKSETMEIKNGKELRSIIESGIDGEAEAIRNIIADTNQVKYMLPGASNPYVFMGDKLTSVGIPFYLAEKVAEQLTYAYTARSAPKHPKLTREQAFRNIASTGKNYITAVRKLIHEATDKEPRPLRYLFHETEDSIRWSAGISTSATISELGDDKNIKIVRDLESPHNPKDTLEKLIKFYPDKDLFVGKNLGACFYMTSDPAGSAINPSSSIIDSREQFDEGSKEDITELVRDILRLGTDAHEVVHASQVGTRLMWRNVVTSISENFCRSALQALDKGYYNRQYPFSHSILDYYKPKKWSDKIIDELAFDAIPALARGIDAENYRNYGFFQIMSIRNISPLDKKDFNYQALYDTAIEESKTAKMYLKTVEVLKSRDRKLISEHLKDVEYHSSQLNGIVEHQAQAFSDHVVLEYVRSGTFNIEYKDLDKLINAASKVTLRRGQLSKKFLDTIKDANYSNLNSEDRARIFADSGIRYKQAILGSEYNSTRSLLIGLGYHQLDPFEAYDDMDELKKRVKDIKMPLEDFLYPINTAVANSGFKYESHLPIYNEIIKKFGSQEAFRRMIDCESLDEIKALLDR